MYSNLSFDELNKLNTRKAMSFEQYFGEMDLTKAEKRKRIALAEKLMDGFRDSMILVFTMLQFSENSINWTSVEDKLSDTFKSALAERGIKTDTYIDLMIIEFVSQFVLNTQNHIDDPYYISEERARANAAEQANTTGNYDNYRDAVNAGKTKKTWVTMGDDRVRPTHVGVDYVTIPIDETFKVGMSEMMFPRDTSYGADADEIVNCRCTVVYS